MEVTLTWSGLDEIISALADLPPQIGVAMVEVETNAAQDIIKALQTYPPAPSSSTYVRTGTLGAGWVMAVSGLTVVITNSVVYEPWVEDEVTQTAVMQSIGWPTWQQVERERMTTLDKELEVSILALLGKAGFDA